MYTDLVKNRICRSGKGFYCFVCEVDVDRKDETFFHVTGDLEHLRELESHVSLKNLKIDEKRCVELINNGIIANNSKEFRCTICCCDIPVRANWNHVVEHLTGKKHLTKKKKFIPDSAEDLVYLNDYDTNSDQQENGNGDHCNSLPDNTKESSKNISILQSNDKTIQSGNLLDNLNCKESNNKVEGNITTVRSESDTVKSSNFLFTCYKCQDVVKSDVALHYHMMFHLSQKISQVTDILHFLVKDNMKQIFCLICDFLIKNVDDLEKHLRDAVHQKRLIIVRCPSNGTIINLQHLNSSLYHPNLVNFSRAYNASNMYNQEFGKYLNYLQNIFQSIAQKNQINDKVLGGIAPVVPQQPVAPQVNFLGSYYVCFICNIKFMNENLLFIHFNSDFIHKFRMESLIILLKDKHIKFISIDNNEMIACLKCQMAFTELSGAGMHIFDPQHQNDEPIELKHIMPDGRVVMKNKQAYTCSLCRINIPNDISMIHHLTSDYHAYKKQEYYANASIQSFKKIIFYCPTHGTNFFDDKAFLDHIYVQHQNGFKSNFFTNDLAHLNNTNMCRMPNTPLMGNINVPHYPMMPQCYDTNYKNAHFMPSHPYNYAQNNVNHVHNHQQRPRVPVNNHNQKNQSKTSSAIRLKNKDFMNFSPRYVQICIERGGENIFTVNDEKMKNLELSISLTFPYKTERCCIPCGLEVSSDLQLLYEHLRTEEHEKNVQDIEDNDRYFENYREQLSDLELAREYMYEYSDKWVKCYACDIKIENCETNLKNHIVSDVHVNKYQFFKKSADEIIKLFYNMFENLWYYIAKFDCYLCGKTYDYEYDYARHLEDIKHLTEVEKRLIKNQSLQFDWCISCSSYWYAKSDYHKTHYTKRAHEYCLKTRDFTVPEMSSEVRQLLTKTEETLEQFIEESEKAAFDGKHVEEQILQNVEKVVQSRYPQAKAYLFGSRISHLSFQNSDLDVYVDCKNEYETLKSKEDNENELSTVQECFFRHEDTWKITSIIHNTRVPIIKLNHRSTNLNCDISFINGLSVEKSKILGYYVQACLSCRKMILYLKKWSALCKLFSGRKGINNFALSWFAIFYLQVQEILPSVQQLIQQKSKSHLVAGWETGVCEQISVKDTNLSTVELLRGFFTYYSEFNYISDVACPFLGKVMKKSNFSEIDELPDEMSFYKKQVKEEKIEFFRLDSPMCIQEPIDLSQNITKSVSKLQLRMFKAYCAESAAVLTS